MLSLKCTFIRDAIIKLFKAKTIHDTRGLIWKTTPLSLKQLKQQGYHVLDYQRIKKLVLASRRTGFSRSSLKNPAQKIMKLYRRHSRLAVLNVHCRNNEDLMVVYCYMLEPALNSGCALLINSETSLSDLARRSWQAESQWGYAWTWERFQYIATRKAWPTVLESPVPVNWGRRWWNKLIRNVDSVDSSVPVARLDSQQMAAVTAGEGVVQIIAPAGSGKTTVLIERVKELIRRGSPACQILCMSFNRDAKVEIGQRLSNAGVEGVVVRSFHGMGLAILKSENQLRANIGGLVDLEINNLISEVLTEGFEDKSILLTVDEARQAIAHYKLALMVPPEEAIRKARGSDLKTRICARVFAAYEKKMLSRGLLDFDDLVARPVALLQSNSEIRERWQQNFLRVLVDEYQDIEPSQALLVGILAAPQDSLFCVGDEDQCIYAWRRATVQRIIELDQVYPGLERHALIRNYRCARRITRASRKLIECNRVRFRKPLLSGAKEKGTIVVVSFKTRAEGASEIARIIHDEDPEKLVVLARTSRLLEEIISASKKLWDKEPNVELSTIHASKGREWNRVILYGVDEGQTPHSQSKGEAGIEDERRLFYVAMTRAISRLEIVTTKGVESRFLREAGLR